MSDLGIPSASGASQTQQSRWAQLKAQWQQLGQALQQGDLAGAQKAFSALQQNAPQGARNGQGGSAQDPFAALGQALQSGDLAGARQALAQIQQAGGRHHHHHHQAAQSDTSSTSSPSTNTTSTSSVDVTA